MLRLADLLEECVDFEFRLVVRFFRQFLQIRLRLFERILSRGKPSGNKQAQTQKIEYSLKKPPPPSMNAVEIPRRHALHSDFPQRSQHSEPERSSKIQRKMRNASL